MNSEPKRKARRVREDEKKGKDLGKGNEGMQKHTITSLKKTGMQITVLTGSVSTRALQNAKVEHRTKGNPFQATNEFTHHRQA